MKFILDESIKTVMAEKKHENIIISQVIRRSWGGAYAEVSAKFSTTGASSPFEKYEVDGYAIYVQPDIPFNKETVTLSIEKMLFFERILIDGVQTS